MTLGSVLHRRSPLHERAGAAAAPRLAWRLFVRVTRPAQGRGWWSRSPRVRAAYRLVTRRLAPPVVTLYGQQIEIDAADSLRLLVRDDYEPEEAAFYRAVVRPGDYVVEAGAHIGAFTNLFASLVGSQGMVVAVEPDPANAALLHANVERNRHHDTVVIHQVAVGSSHHVAGWFRSAENTGDNRLFGDPDERSTFEVEVTSLDALVGDCRIDLLKMDIQGAEAAALDGLRETLSVRPPRRILLEFWPYGLRRSGCDPLDLLRTLETHGYRLDELLRGTEGTRPVDTDELISRLPPAEHGWSNLIATHASAQRPSRPDGSTPR